MKVLGATDLAVPAVGATGAAVLAVAGLWTMAAGALCGTVLAAVSWFALRVLGARLVRAGAKSSPVIAAIMGFKLMFMAMLVWLAVSVLHFDGIGLAVGLSALPVGILAAFALCHREQGPGTETPEVGEVKGDA